MLSAKNNNKIDLKKEIDKVQKSFSLELLKIQARRDAKIKKILKNKDLKDTSITLNDLKLNKKI